MDNLHIEDFYKNTAKTFLQLYKSFPNKTILYVEDISGEDTPDEFGLHSPTHLSCLSAIVWLAEHSYVAFDSIIRQEAFDQIVLTEKTFLLLSSHSLPDDGTTTTEELPSTVVEDYHSNIAILSRAVQSSSSTSIKHIVYQLLLLSREFR